MHETPRPALSVRSRPVARAQRPLLLLFAVLPAGLAAQETPVRDLVLPEAELVAYEGHFEVTALTAAGADGAPSLDFHFFVRDGALQGQIDRNEPTRMLYQGGSDFRPEDAPVFLVRFEMEGGRATGLRVRSPEGTMTGTRVAEPTRNEPDPARSGELYDQLARLDAALFDAIFVQCDAGDVLSLVSDDAEFYHDKSGFQVGPAVQQGMRDQADDCPRDSGVRRVLREGTLQVHPMRGADGLYGAVQEGVHDFVEDGAPTFTRARFVHFWARTETGWKISRVLSFDHQSLPVGQR